MTKWFPNGVDNQRKGDIAVFNPRAEWEVLHPGSNGQALVLASGLPSYGYPAGLTIVGAVIGDMLYFDGTNWVRLATANRGLLESTTAGAPKWTAVAPAQGNILYYNGTDWVVLAVGTAGQSLRTLGAAANPAWGAPAWTAWTPTITAGAGVFTTVSGAGAYLLDSKLLTFRLLISITTNGTAATNIQIPLPLSLNAKGAQAVAGFNTGNVWSIGGWIQDATNNINLYKYDATYPGGNNVFLVVHGVLEVA